MRALSVAAGICGGLVAVGAANAAPPPPPPASAFGRIPAIVEAAISPDGKHVAVLGGTSDQRIITIATIDQPGLPGLALGPVEAVGLRWGDNSHVLTRVAFWYNPAPRIAYRMERNVSVDLTGHAVARMLDKGDGASSLLTYQPVLGVTDAPQPRVMMIGLADSTGANADMDTHIARKGDAAFVLGLFSVDPATGRGSLVEKGNADTESWEVDASGQPRVRVQIDELTHHVLVMGRAKDKSQYAPIWGGGDFETRRHYLGYSAGEDAIYVTDKDQLFRKRLTDAVSTPVAQAPVEGGLSLVWDDLRLTAVGVRAGREKITITWFDPQLGAIDTALSKALPGQLLELENWSADRSRFIIRASSSASPAVWYLFDAARKELSPLGEEYPELKGVQLATKRWITYKARDGLEIPAYLTLPPDAPAGARPPLIVLPHGGPAARDDDDFDFLVQFLATRGYAVLQPQFRGSAGFGQAFEDAGKGEWGGKMQTDLLDGIAAVGALGAADPQRVCIVGWSFGGYAAMAGAAFHSSDYRCAASFAGVSDLGKLLVEEGRVYGRDSASLGELKQALGAASSERIADASPARHAVGVNIPLLLVHADKDTVVPIEQSEIMAEAMKAAGKPVQFVTIADDNHYLTKTATRTQFLETLEAFLAKNLPVSR